MKMLLIIEALLLILAALGQDNSNAEVEIISLDMAPNSVDDQYVGCRDKMAKLVETELLNNELKTTPDFKTAWEEGEESAKSENHDLTKNQSIAIYAYSGDYVHRIFNRDTRNSKTQFKDKKFQWYSLHFLLTEAIQILHETQNKCYTTYRGTDVEFKTDVLNKEIRFGSFTSSSLYPDVAQRFGRTSCFKIYTCEGANVTNYTKLTHEEEVLIPPYEMFKVTAVKTEKFKDTAAKTKKFKVTAVKTGVEQKDVKCKTVFTLKSTGRVSNLNCAVFQH